MTSAPPATAATEYYPTATTSALAARPWTEFFDTSSLLLPVSFSDASTRLNRNLTQYRVNYAIIASLILIVTLIFHPIPLLIIAGIFAAWFFLYFSRPSDIPLEILGFEITDRVLLIVLSIISLLGFIFASVWLNLIISVAISVAIVCLHGVLRVPSFIDGDPYGGLLDPTSGAYICKLNCKMSSSATQSTPIDKAVDPGKKYAIQVDPNNRNNFRCTHCEKFMK